MTSTISPPTASTPIPVMPVRSRRWAATGLAAGVAGVVSVVSSSLSGAVYEEDISGDAVGITDRLAEMLPQILVFHTATMVAALLLVVFAAGLRRELGHRLGADSLLPQVASSGLMLVSVALLMGSALTTEFAFAVSDPGLIVPETAAVFGHWIGTVPWVWGGAGLTALAVGVAALRHGAGARWLGWSSLVLGGLTTLFAVSPLQYMAGMFGPLWVLLASVGFLAARTARG